MNEATIKSPGVYIDEIDAFPNSIVPVATAVPAFIGYTPQAEYQGKSYQNTATKITSFAEFDAIFCYPDPPAPAVAAKQYNPQYYLVKEKSKPQKGDFLHIDGVYYSIVPDPNTIYYLYNSVKLFYENGGGDAYIVSVGSYGAATGIPMTAGTQIVNTNVKLNELLNGLALLKNEQEPTLYICPEATLLSVKNNATLMQEMLLQNTEVQTAISVFDVIGGRNPDPVMYINDIKTFRTSTGSNGLSHGAAYYPFIGTIIMQASDLDYTNLFGGDVKQLERIINPAAHPNETITTIFSKIESGELTTAQGNNVLTNASKTYASIMKHVLADANVLPPSGGMAGVMTNTDNQVGVWKAPANASIVGTVSLPIDLSNSQQADLNVDASSGKSINAIRKIKEEGILIWGARTLDGNSQDWKYISVRRTMTFLEQSCKLACRAYVFQPNDATTWQAVKAMIGSFLTSIWKEGGLQGSKASEAYSVECGLGTTMTEEDILNGLMKVSVKVAAAHPAEFIILTFEQEMSSS